MAEFNTLIIADAYAMLVDHFSSMAFKLE